MALEAAYSRRVAEASLAGGQTHVLLAPRPLRAGGAQRGGGPVGGGQTSHRRQRSSYSGRRGGEPLRRRVVLTTAGGRRPPPGAKAAGALGAGGRSGRHLWPTAVPGRATRAKGSAHRRPRTVCCADASGRHPLSGRSFLGGAHGISCERGEAHRLAQRPAAGREPLSRWPVAGGTLRRAVPCAALRCCCCCRRAPTAPVVREPWRAVAANGSSTRARRSRRLCWPRASPSSWPTRASAATGEAARDPSTLHAGAGAGRCGPAPERLASDSGDARRATQAVGLGSP